MSHAMSHAMSYAMTEAMKNSLIVATIKTFEKSPIIYRLGSTSRSHNQKAMDDFAVGARLLSFRTGETLELTGAQWRALTKWGMEAELVVAHNAGAPLVTAYNENVRKHSKITTVAAEGESSKSGFAQFLKCPNGKVWRLYRGQVSGIVTVDLCDALKGGDAVSKAISRAATGSVSGLADIVYTQTSPSVFEFHGHPKDLQLDADEQRKDTGYKVFETYDSELRELLCSQYSIDSRAASVITSNRGAPLRIEDEAPFAIRSLKHRMRRVAMGSALNMTVMHARVGSEIIWSRIKPTEERRKIDFFAMESLFAFLNSGEIPLDEGYLENVTAIEYRRVPADWDGLTEFTKLARKR